MCFSKSFSTFFLSGWLPGNLGPFSNERSQNSASDTLNEISVRWNLTQCMSVQSSEFHVFFCFFLSNFICFPMFMFVFFTKAWLEEPPPEKWETPFAYVLLTESIGSMSLTYFPSFPWCVFHHQLGQQDKRLDAKFTRFTRLAFYRIWSRSNPTRRLIC